MSAKSFTGFCQRNKTWLWKEIHASQKCPEKLRKSLSELHTKTLRVRRQGSYTSRRLANIQGTKWSCKILLPFVFDDNKTYDKEGSEKVWMTSSQSSLEKGQSIIQLIVFAYGKTLSPIIIFRGQGLRINAAKKMFFSGNLGVTKIFWNHGSVKNGAIIF